MTQDEIISKLQSDALFALGFAVDNNLDGVVISLKNKGINVPLLQGAELKKWCYEKLVEILKSNKQLCIDIISAVQYNKDATNYTAGFYDYFANTQPADTVTAQQKFDVNALLGGLGSGLLTYASISGDLGGAGTTQTQAEKEAIAAAEKADAERKKRTTNIIIGVVVGIVVIAVLFAVFKKKKSS